ncbi:bromodomain adjacent to zinc finger domain protein 2A isoform X1 [Corythoichthys intestinalis]|uniref:bromodomain adjacent to zinc finger domain protein 2A isoform X1 n=2 Tax=Corythoichthys intestinalis TaxID=161448 RepID=UPI0025A6581C|nr:bromodomain adjacent to zinc finger domain protein 2A isoform X1 [Corythoichthys intestinalis]
MYTSSSDWSSSRSSKQNEMEANNHFNYGTHSSPNSGLKRSSGDSHYTNGSSMSFPQQGKNMNGEMNVNGVTTALGSGPPASQPPSSPYPLISNHLQSSMGYLWGGHPQFSPGMAASAVHGVHQKQPTPGIVQPQSHHFQAQGPYQLNGDVDNSQQSLLAGPSNMPPTSSQFWNRSNPAPQSAAYTSRSMFGTYESQAHRGISPPQHNQQVSPPSSQHHLHPNLRPPIHLTQHYGVLSNGMPYYQQQHVSLTSPQHPKQSTSQVHMREESKEPNKGSSRTEETAAATRPPNSSSTSVRHVREHESSEKLIVQPPEGVRVTAASTPPRALAAPLTSAAASQNKMSSAPAIDSPMASPASSIGSHPDIKSTPPQASTPSPRHSSPPLPFATEMTLPGSKHLVVGSLSSSSSTTHPKYCPPPGLTDSVSGDAQHQSISRSITAVLTPAIVSTSSYSGSTPISSLQQMVQGSKIPLMPAVPSNLSKCDSSGSIRSSTGSSPDMSQSTQGMPSTVVKPQHDSLYSAAAVGSGHANVSVSPTPEGLNSPSLSARDSPSASPLITLPLRTTQSTGTAPVLNPPALASVPPATSSKRNQSSDSGQNPSTSSSVSVLNQLLVLPEHQGHSNMEKDFVHGKGTTGEVCPTNVESSKGRTHKVSDPQKSSDLPGQHLPSEHEPSNKHSSLIVETSFDHSSLSSQYGESSGTPARIHISSFLDKSFANSTPNIRDSRSFGNGFHSGNASSQFASICHTEEQRSSLYETTGDGSSSMDYSSLNSTQERERSETGESMLESSLNNASFGPSQRHHQETGPDWIPVGLHAPDPNATAIEFISTPSCKTRDENFIAFSTPAHRPAEHSLQPVADQVFSATGGSLKSPVKPCKPQSPKALWIRKSAPKEAKRRPRGRTPRVDKIDSADGENKEEGAKGRKRKVSLRPEQVTETSNKCDQIQPPSEEIDSITATIEAVLANTSAITLPFEKSKKIKRAKKHEQDGKDDSTQNDDTGEAASDAEDNVDETSTSGRGTSVKRRVATEQQVQFPLLHGWKREIRVRKLNDRMRGETWYYTPCGRRMKQFPEVIKYLKKHQGGIVTREHFSFSPRMPVGDFYEERESPEGAKWFLLANEEIPSMIMAITGRRGRPPNPEKEKLNRLGGPKTGQARRPGRPPKPKMIDFLSKVDAKLLQRLEDKESLTEEEKEKMAKIKKKMKRKARIRRREDAKMKKIREDKKKAKILEMQAEPQDSGSPQTNELSSQPVDEPRKPGRRRSVKVETPPPVQQTDEERIAQGKRVLSARGKAKALAKVQAEAEAAARAALAAKKNAERRVQTQRRLEERRRQQLIIEELRKPTEDMCLTDHKPLPELSRVPGVILSGTAFAHCLAVVEFLHAYGKLIGLNVPKDIPSLATLQEGLLDVGESQGEVQDLLIKLMEAALRDPGLPSYYQSVKILGEKLVDLQLTRSTVSEVLRIFLESHGYETEVCNTLRTKSFHTLPPETKAAVLGFVVEELNGSNIVTSDIDNTLENMSTYRKNKWIIEGKLRKLKAALARRTGRSEEELCLEERRRSARVAEEANLGLEESILERSNRRGRKEEPKTSDSESPNNASVHELERQIDKLNKRQAFFRKKLLQTSHSMRAVILGQDRYRRRYLALPHLGGVLVEGPEELLTSGDVVIAEVPVTFLQKEPKKEEVPVITTPPHSTPSSPTPQTQILSPDEDALPGTASLMSTPKGRGRPRKIKPEVELHLRTAKIRRQRRSSVRSMGGEDVPGSPVSTVTTCTQDLSQSAFLNWLSQSRHAVPDETDTTEPLEGSQPMENVKDEAENREDQCFKQESDNSTIDTPQMQSTIPTDDAPLRESDMLMASGGEAPTAPDTPVPPEEVPSAPQTFPDCTPPLPTTLPSAQTTPAARTPTTRARPGRRRRRGSRGSSPARRGPRGGAAKRRGRPPTSVFQELEQQYFIQLVVKPIPASMVRGWWWIKDPEELFSTLQALHPRGVREKVLHKHLAKHMESLTEMCSKSINDPIFELKEEKKERLLEALQQPWQVQDKAMETDNSVLRWVEDLEQRVFAADLHLKAAPQSLNDAESKTDAPAVEFQAYAVPERDSTRADLQYYEHDTDPRDDWIVRTKKEWSGLPRIATHPLDLAVLRLANLERNIERRYLKEPLWNLADVMRLAPLTPTPGEEQPMDVISLESEITSRLRTWRQALDRCRSAPQLCLCLLQLEKAIAWERSVTKVTCQICRKGDNDDCLLLCDGCDRGCHMYCLKPKITQVPEGDWFCPTCVAKEESESPQSKKRTRVKKKRYEENSSDDDTTTRRSSGMSTRHKDTATATAAGASSSSSSRHSVDGGAAKRRRMTTRNQPDLTFCEIILMEMEAHADAWPFLEPVNPRLVPGYRRIVKNPMDFLTMRERLLQGGYCSCEEFLADAQLVFNNCELFNEDTSEVGMAGHSMRRFFESRWAEFYSNKEK